jgi:hypothetical protein
VWRALLAFADTNDAATTTNSISSISGSSGRDTMTDQQRWTMDFSGLGTSYDKKHNLDPPGYDAQAARDPVRLRPTPAPIVANPHYVTVSTAATPCDRV